MKINDLKKWRISDDNIGLLIFVERLLELSYDGTPVAEKNIEPTVWEILDDCYKLIHLVESGVRKNARDELDFFVTKLITSIKKDTIAKELLYGSDSYIVNRLSIQNSEEFKTLLNLIRGTLSYSVYWENLKNRIQETVKDKKNKKEIIAYADRCFYFLIRAGYVKSSIYYLLQKTFFFDLNNEMVSDHTYIKKYFNLFDLKVKKFDVYFKCSNAIEDLKGGFDVFSIEFIVKPEPKYDLYCERKFFKNKFVNYVICSDIGALDYLHAVQIARNKLNKISNIFSLMYHKARFWYSDDCLVYNKNKEHVVKLIVPSNPMSKTADIKIDHAKEFLGEFIKSFRMNPQSFDRFNQSIELHALALKTDSLSAQVLNLWICIESLLVTGKGSHVGEVESYLTNIVCNDYLTDKLADIDLYLTSWNASFYENILDKVDSSSKQRRHKLAEILCFREHDEILKQLGSELAEKSISPLLLNKVWEASILFRSVKKIKETRKITKDKIKFDIKRIYLLRNEIVHQGEVNKARENIVELAHYYLDNVLNEIVGKSFDRRRNISDFLYEQKMISDEYDRLLDSMSDETVIDANNFRAIVFSPDYHTHNL